MTAVAVLGLPAMPTSAAAVGATGDAGAPAGARAGYGLSLADFGGFEQALQRAQAGTSPADAARVAPSSEVAAQVFKPFDHINAEAQTLARMAESARLAGAEMRPGDVVQLTLRCQEFMFHCQLTSNIANRGSDGLQQLFRQQG